MSRYSVPMSAITPEQVRADLAAARERVTALENLLQWIETAYPEVAAPERPPPEARNVAPAPLRGPPAAQSGPLSGLQAIDGMVYVLDERNSPMTLDQMTERMLELGWETRGDKPKETLRVALRRDEGRKVRRVERGLYGLPEWGFEFEPPPTDDPEVDKITS